MNKKAFGKSIKYYREEKHLSQGELASRVHISQQTMSAWECGTSYPDVESIEALCGALEISENDLFERGRLIEATEGSRVSVGKIIGIATAVIVAIATITLISLSAFKKGKAPIKANKDEIIATEAEPTVEPTAEPTEEATPTPELQDEAWVEVYVPVMNLVTYDAFSEAEKFEEYEPYNADYVICKMPKKELADFISTDEEIKKAFVENALAFYGIVVTNVEISEDGTEVLANFEVDFDNAMQNSINYEAFEIADMLFSRMAYMCTPLEDRHINVSFTVNGEKDFYTRSFEPDTEKREVPVRPNYTMNFPTTLVDNELYSVVLTGLDTFAVESEFRQNQMDVIIKNKNDKPMILYTSGAYINGIEAPEVSQEIEVAAECEINVTVILTRYSIYDYDLSIASGEDVKKIEFFFNAVFHNENDYQNFDSSLENVVIYPYGKENYDGKPIEISKDDIVFENSQWLVVAEKVYNPGDRYDYEHIIPDDTYRYMLKIYNRGNEAKQVTIELPDELKPAFVDYFNGSGQTHIEAGKSTKWIVEARASKEISDVEIYLQEYVPSKSELGVIEYSDSYSFKLGR